MRLRRYALCSAVDAVAFLVALVGAVVTPVAGTVAVGLAVAMFWAWGPFQAEIALNPRFDDVDRRRWRLLVFVPGALAVYWHRHLRPYAP
jgi:hypothetical protein